MLCSIVIRAFNEEKHIGRLLDGIVQQNIQDFEIILVDSGSTDATVIIASRYPVKIFHLTPEEFTFGRSLNLGIAQAKGEFLVFASAHVFPVYPDWLAKLLNPFEDANVALVYGKQRGGSETLFSEDQIFTHWFSDQAQERQSHPFCNNANLAIRRSFWELHHYDESLPALEDLEWGNWAMEHGYAIAYAPEAEIVHIHNESWRGVYNRYRREAIAFKLVFPREQFHLWNFIRLFIANAINDSWQARIQGKLKTSLGSILWFRFAQFWGTYQGYRHSGPLTWQLRKTFYYPGGNSNTASKSSRHIDPIRYNEILHK
jgi:glycosyltransferase involved in cell wall biosynthesis